MVLIVFRYRFKPGIDAQELGATGARLDALATRMPGFISYKDFAAPDGEGVTIVAFESQEALAAWRMHPEHVAAQERGRKEWYADYRVTVADVVRDKTWPSEAR
jgi:heme-degrading monooxygenase HmoA